MDIVSFLQCPPRPLMTHLRGSKGRIFYQSSNEHREWPGCHPADGFDIPDARPHAVPSGFPRHDLRAARRHRFALTLYLFFTFLKREREGRLHGSVG